MDRRTLGKSWVVLGSQQAVFASWAWEAGKSEEVIVIEIGEPAPSPQCGQVIILRFWRDDTADYHTNWAAVDPEDLQ